MYRNWNQDVYNTAWHFAIKAHGNQTCPSSQKGVSMPYATHLGSVAMELIAGIETDADLNGNLAIQCALLHDTIEDTSIDFATIEAHFGLDVANGVLALTKNKKLPTKREQICDSLDRIILQPREIWMVKLSDRISNLQSIPLHWDITKLQAYREESILIYEYLHAANELLGQRLAEKIEAYKKYISKM